MRFQKLALCNLIRRPGRSLTLLALVALLSFSLFGGAVVISSLRTGMENLEGRLGADIIVVPSSAKSKINLDNMLLSGTTGYYYMNSEVLDKIRATQNVEQAAAQLYMASLRASCCSVAVQVIGFDPETDVTVQPWVKQSFSGTLGDYDVIAGSAVSAAVGSDIKIYEQNCRVVGKLETTGTEMDTAIYTTVDTVRLLLQAARDMGHDLKISGDPQDVISAVYVKVRDGADVESVENDINIHVRKVEAVSTKSMLSGVSDSMAGISRTMAVLIGIIWLLVLLVLILALVMINRERKKEFALLRALGASGGMLSGMIFKETFLLCLAGGAAGILATAAVVLPFRGLIESGLNLPFLVPGPLTLLLLGVGTLLAVTAVGVLAGARSIVKMKKAQPGQLLREAG